MPLWTGCSIVCTVDVDRADAAQLVRERRDAGVEVRGVGEHDEVRREHVLVRAGGSLPRFSEPISSSPSITNRTLSGSSPFDLQVRGDRGDVRHHARLVVGGAAAEEPAVAHGGLVGRRDPLLVPALGLHVVVAVEEDRRRARLAEPVAVDVRVDARDLEDLHVLDPRRAHHVGRLLGRAAQVLVRGGLGRHAGNAAEPHELGLEIVEVGVEVIEGGLQVAVRLRHEVLQSGMSRSAAERRPVAAV